MEKEYDEDRELLELLSGTNKSKSYFIFLYLFIALNKKKNVINEVIEEEDEEKNNKINENKENNNVGIKNSDNNNNNYNTNIERRIKYVPYNKINIKKHNSESLIQIKKNEYKKLLSSENNIDKNINLNNNYVYNNIIINNKEIKLSNNTHNSSSSKNLFGNKINMSNINSNLKDNKDKKKYFAGKWSSLSNRQANSNENIFNKKLVNHNNNLSLRDKIIKDKVVKESATLPELNPNSYKNSVLNKNNIKNVNENYNVKKISTFKSKTIFDEKLKYFRTKSVSSDTIKVSNNNDINKNNKNNLLNYSPSTSAYTNSTKKINTNKTNNLTEDLSKFRIGLLSAGSSSYTNVIIPMISLKRPVSNFNFGGDKLWNNMGDVNINNLDNHNDIKDKKDYESKPKEKEDSVIFRNNKNTLNGVFNNKKIVYKSQKYNEKLSDSENHDELMYKNMDKLIPKFHKIKIEKGLMNTKIANSLGKKLFINYYNQRNKNNKLAIRFSNNNERKNNNFNN